MTDVAVIALGNGNGAGQDADAPQGGDLVGLLLNESFQGCSLVVLNRADDAEFLSKGTECVVKAGALHPMPAVVRWRETIAPELLKVGVEFLE